MYGKLFGSMYDGTLVASWEALITFQQMIILADDVGVVDITPAALSARTGIPIRLIKKGITVLEADDAYSRSPDQNGRRIERLDDHRPWGWRIVNYMKYRQLFSHEEKKQADRERVAAKRAKEKDSEINDVAGCRKVSQSVADVAHIDTDTYIYTKKKKTSRFAPPSLGEIKKYIKDKGYSVNASSFLSHYESNGWMVGKNKMKDWQAAIRGWESRDNPKPKTPLPRKQYNPDGTERT